MRSRGGSDDNEADTPQPAAVRSAGGDLYYNGLRTTTHPHLHVQIGNYGMVRVGRNIQLAVSMMAWTGLFWSNNAAH